MRWFFLSFIVLVTSFGVALYNVTKEAPIPAQILQKNDSRTVIGANAPEIVHVLIEIQQGTQSRYEYDSEEEILRLVEAPYHELLLPGDYGVLPQTFTRGGGLLGAVVLTTDPTPQGTLLEARPIAVIIADEGSVVRTTILAVPVADIRYRDVYEIADLQLDDKNAVIDYIQNYRSLQGRPAVSVSYDKAEVAKRIITVAMEAYAKTR